MTIWLEVVDPKQKEETVHKLGHDRNRMAANVAGTQ